MQEFSISDACIDGIKIINPFIYEDERGVFVKDFDSTVFIENGLGDKFVFNEEFFSVSKKGVVRGLHFQVLNPQAKLVSCTRGKVCDVIVDLRKNSKSFGKYFMIELSEDNHKVVYIPKGFAHGFLSLEDNSVTSYKCIGEFSKSNDSNILWNDKDLDIKWPLEMINEIILSDRDKKAMSFKEFCDKYGGL